MPTSAVPAVPAARHPQLRRTVSTGARLDGRPPVTDLQLMFLGLSPVTAAAAVLLAGCGVRGFVISDPRPVTWDDAAAGAFDLPDVGRSRDLGVRQRIRAANPNAVALSDPARFTAEDRPSSLVIRAVDLSDPDGASLDLRAAAAEGRVRERQEVLDVVVPGGHAPGTTMLWPVRPWYARACTDCMAKAAGTAQPEPSRGARYDAWPTHTALAAAVLAQAVIAQAGAGGPEVGHRGHPSNGPVDGSAAEHVTVLHPGGPVSTIERVPNPQAACPLCAAG